jgi:hypothetical protein
MQTSTPPRRKKDHRQHLRGQLEADLLLSVTEDDVGSSDPDSPVRRPGGGRQPPLPTTPGRSLAATPATRTPLLQTLQQAGDRVSSPSSWSCSSTGSPPVQTARIPEEAGGSTAVLSQSWTVFPLFLPDPSLAAAAPSAAAAVGDPAIHRVIRVRSRPHDHPPTGPNARPLSAAQPVAGGPVHLGPESSPLRGPGRATLPGLVPAG